MARNMTTIEQLRPGDWTAALECALARLPAEQRSERVRHCLDLLAEGTLDPRGVFVARAGREIVGVQVCVPLAGAACLVWLPTTDDEHADALVEAALSWCRAQGCKIAQALAGPEDGAWTAPLRLHGFRPITQLHQLTHELIDLPPMPNAPLRFLPYRPSLESAFADTLERTYIGTLDCPELNGVRTIAEILAGHRAQGQFDPDSWRLAYDDAGPVGVVLRAELSDGLTWELSYVGVVPEARRRGHGRALVLHAMHDLARRNVLALTLAVDGRNAPARSLYRELGFVEIECNDVWLYFF